MLIWSAMKFLKDWLLIAAIRNYKEGKVTSDYYHCWISRSRKNPEWDLDY